jgi:hypothetical protein
MRPRSAWLSTGAAEDLARRLYLDRRLRRELAEDVLGLDLEALDERAAEALARSHVEIRHGDGSAR